MQEPNKDMMHTTGSLLALGAPTTERGNAHAILQGINPAITITDVSKFTASSPLSGTIFFVIS